MARGACSGVRACLTCPKTEVLEKNMNESEKRKELESLIPKPLSDEEFVIVMRGGSIKVFYCWDCNRFLKTKRGAQRHEKNFGHEVTLLSKAELDTLSRPPRAQGIPMSRGVTAKMIRPGRPGSLSPGNPTQDAILRSLRTRVVEQPPQEAKPSDTAPSAPHQQVESQQQGGEPRMSDGDPVKNGYCAFYYSEERTRPFRYDRPSPRGFRIRQDIQKIKAKIQAELSVNRQIILLESKFGYTGVGFLRFGGPGASNGKINDLLDRLNIPCDEVHPVSEL